MSTEDPSEPSMAGELAPRDLLGDIFSPAAARGNSIMASTGGSTEPPSTEAEVFLPHEVILHATEGTLNTETPGSDLTTSPGSGTPGSVGKSPQSRKIPNFQRLERKFAIGYDSDGEEPPSTVPEEFEEPPIRGSNWQMSLKIEVSTVDEEEEAKNGNILAVSEPRHIAIDESVLIKMTINNQKHELRIREVQFSFTLFEETGPS
jgi:hypothetical protein